jgi:DNA-binding Lrp family transcriptional regulator
VVASNVGREKFRMVPDRLWLDLRLHAADVRVWCALAFTARERGFADTTDATLAEMVHLSERSVRDSLSRLQEAKFIRRQGRGSNRTISLHPEGDGTPVEGLALKVIG